MTGLVKSPLQIAVVEGIYNDILTKNARYYYFLGKTDKWSVADGASPGEDGVWTTTNGMTILGAPAPVDTFRYELDARNNIIAYKLVKSSDVAFILTRYDWITGHIWDMYDDSYSTSNLSATGSSTIEGAKYYVLTSLNNIYKCISNNYNAVSTVEPTGISTDEFTTADGYIWKFMYNIPVALQNKFYTANYIPVMTSLRNKFYENGSIGSVAVLEPGSGYTNNASLTVSGDGFLENNPYSVGHFGVIVSGGAGYKSTVTLTGATWLSTVATMTSIAHGFLNGDNITIRGAAPSGYNGDFIVANKTADTFTIVIASDPGIWTSGGNVTLKLLTFSAPLWGNAKTQIKGSATITSGALNAVTLDVQVVNAQNVYGYGYDQTGTVVVAAPFLKDHDWAATTTFIVDKIIKANDNYYKVTAISKTTQSLTWTSNVATVTTTTPHGFSAGDSIIISGVTAAGYNGTFTIVSASGSTFTYALVITNPGTASIQGSAIQANGTTNATLPIHTTGIIVFGSCSLLFIGTQAKVNLALSKTEAIMSPIVQGGQITGVTITDGGVGYTYCNIVPQDTTPNSSAILVPDLSIGNIDTTQADVELMAQSRNGAISYVKMVKNSTGDFMTGRGYGIDTAVTITGDGTGATAIPVIVNGSISAITLTNHGTGYKHEANITITSVNGIGAQARAILCPSGGHGSNAIKEFNSKSILFYSVLSDERIHGLQNLNDYRQFGVIKNPNRYGSTSRFSLTTGTSCWLVTSTSNINISNFIRDDSLLQSGETYRVIEIKDDKMVIQSYTLTAPTISDFTNVTQGRNGNILTVKNLTAPQVDKFTGDMLFIDNKLPFVVTVDQMIVFRTTLGF